MTLVAAYSAGRLAALRKYADVSTDRKPHQQRVSDRLSKRDQPGLVVVHGLGSGKTLTALGAQDDLGLDATAVVPAALKANIRKEHDKHITGEGPKLDVRSLQDLALKRDPIKSKMLIVDEAHRARDPSSSTFQTLAKSQADKRLLLTGSPFYNHPSDISALVDLAAGQQILPLDPAAFSERYIKDIPQKPGFVGSLLGVNPGSKPILNPRRAAELESVFNKWVDYHPGISEGFPTVRREDVRVPMTPEQLKVYDTVFKKAPFWVDYKVRRGLPPSKSEARDLNAFLSGARQISNTTAPFVTDKGNVQQPKIDAAFGRLQKLLDESPQAKAVVYSNFLDAGLNPYKQRLDAAHIPYGEFSGEMPHAVRDQLVRDYNENKIRALLLSSAGGEGLDLKGTRLIQLLEPHWNVEKPKQVEGRGIRFKSHDDLPPEERNVRIERYLATRPPSGILERHGWKKPGGSVDEYMTQLGQDKEDLISQFRALLKEPQENDGDSSGKRQ